MKKNPNKIILMILFFPLIISLLVPTGLGMDPELNVIYYGQEYTDWQDDPVRAALSLDDSFAVSQISPNMNANYTQISNSNVIVIQDQILTNEELNLIKNWVQEGNSIIIFCGPNLSTNSSIFVILEIINDAEKTQIYPGYTNAVPAIVNNNNGIITGGFDWNSMPDIQNYTIFPNNIKISEGTLIAKQSREDSIRQIEDPLLFQTILGNGSIVVYTTWTESGYSKAFTGSPFFNYLIYSTAITRGGLDNTKQTYQEWEYTPIPHSNDQFWFILLIVVAIIIGIVVVRKARQNSKVKLDFNFEGEKKIKNIENLKKGSEDNHISQIVTENGSISYPNKVQSKDEKKQELREFKKEGWEKIGLHKQISGFFISLMTALIAAGPQILMVLFIFPRYIMPYPQASGYFSIVKDLFAAVWLVLDVGTSVALVTFFSANRIERPQKAIHYIQIYIFWQLITGIIQFGIVTFLSLYYFPTSVKYAHLSYHFLLHSMIQFPGYLSVVLLTLRALQRSDLEQIASLLLSFVIKIAILYACVVICRMIFKNSVKYGEIFGAVVGLNIGTWMGGFAEYYFTYYLFRKAGYSGKMFFRWDFTKEEVIEVLKFGIRLVAGNVWVPAVATLQAILLTTYVSDYASEFAYYQLALQIGQVLSLVGMFTDSIQAPIAEAYSFKKEHGKEMYLARVYVSSFKWVNYLNFFLLSCLFVIGGRLIIGFSGPTWDRATFYLNLILIFQMLGVYSWIGDKFMLGCNMPSTIMYIWIIEQGVRAIGLLIFIPLYGMIGVMLAYIPGLLAKDIILIYTIRKKIIAPKWYWWQVWITPLIAGLINYGLLELVAQLIWDGGIVTSIVLFFIAVILFINIFCFITGILGGWDKNQLKELKLAIDISPKVLNSYIKLIYFSARIGSKVKNPLIDKFHIDIWEEAQREMEELQTLKKRLTI